jgi:hypothetical protein
MQGGHIPWPVYALVLSLIICILGALHISHDISDTESINGETSEEEVEEEVDEREE